ncbi:agarase [Pseudocolwellia agarivorans]|uniref:agarase n=1 Tax=Pseudocolwellia agarivorans TaxID=1911682 RepID=UPI00158C0240|nr:agarase [Pseudocolwellia agarivorans]
MTINKALSVIEPQKIKYNCLATLISVVLSTSIIGCSTDSAQNAESVSSSDASQTASAVDVFANEKVLTSLINFNSEDKRSWVNSNKTQFTYISNNTDNKLAIEFLNTENISELVIEPKAPWDLSGVKNYNLAFDVKNTGDESLHLYLKIQTPQGQYQTRSISLPTQYSGTVYFPLEGKEGQTDTGMWGDARPWQTNNSLMVWRSWKSASDDFSVIKSLTFFTIGILKNKSVVIDDIRIRENPKSDPNWMVGVIDKYGQNAKRSTALDIKSDEQLKAIADEELAELAKSKGMPDRSKFGGYTKGPKLEATGFFRTEKVNGKWWMVDPEGNIFFSHGPANVRMANMTTITGIDYNDSSIREKSSDEITPEDSMGIIKIPNSIRKDNYVISELRNNMFEWLPSYDDPLAEHYSYRRSTHKGPVPYGETFSFYRANLERRYGETTPESYVKKWHQVTADRMHDWGFTSFGNWVDPAFYQSEQVPYFANGWIIGDFKTLSGKKNHWGLMPDPYDPVFAERAKITIDAIAKNIQSSPWCAGIFIDNEKSWGEREGSVHARYGVILDALSKSVEESPAKKAYSAHLKEKYKNIDTLNSAWNTEIANWNSFDKGADFFERVSYSKQHVSDLSKMLEMLGEQYFIVVHNTLEKALPNHLYMGARMANWGMPDEIIKASLKYSDVLSFNIYEEGMQDHFWKFLEEVDLPVVVGEFHIGTATDSGMYNPGIVHAANQENRAQMYKNYMESVLNKPYMVGAHWFQYIDEPISGRAFDGENANIGFVTVTDIPYPEMIKAVKEVTSSMYQQRYEN